MEKANQLPDFFTNYFFCEGATNKMVAVPEMLPSLSGLDFTGNYLGILIIAGCGTMTFLKDEHPKKVWKCNMAPLETSPVDFDHHFTFSSFVFNGELYKVALTSELGTWEEDAELSATGSFEGLLISEKTGTIAFQLMPDEKKGWECECEEQVLQTDLIERLGRIATNIKVNQFV